MAGGAERKGQWDIWRAMRDGSYNARMDVKEGPWKGRTEMALYDLVEERHIYGPTPDGKGIDIIRTIRSEDPIAVLLHGRGDGVGVI
mmetsp:Transcript_7008/g.14591  ORF Transcript_7008/g.14591 Transcript_7008/m.14591 type:complete len:87 (-) Transcript_7008:665-925(-)